MSTNVPTTSGSYTEKELNDGKPLAAVGYFCLCCIPGFLLPLLAAKENRFAQFHAKQGAVLWAVGVAVFLGVFLLQVVLSLVSPSLARAVGCVGTIAGIGLIVMMVIGIVNALQGQAKELPFLGQFSSKVPF